MVTPRFPACALHGGWYGGMAPTRVAPHYSEQKKPATAKCSQHDPSNTERRGDPSSPRRYAGYHTFTMNGVGIISI